MIVWNPPASIGRLCSMLSRNEVLPPQLPIPNGVKAVKGNKDDAKAFKKMDMPRALKEMQLEKAIKQAAEFLKKQEMIVPA